jgi:hypothetical protein
MSKFPFLQRMRPLIERAAKSARESASRSSFNGAYLMTVYMTVRDRLTITAERLENEERVAPDRWSEPMTREEFEEYLMRLGGVWVVEPEDEDGRD